MTSKKAWIVAGLVLVGCAGRPALFPNSDPALRKTTAQFAADAAKRHPFPTTQPTGEAMGRAEVGVTSDVVQIGNLSDADWTDVDVWLNRTHVVNVPRFPKGQLRTLNFMMFFDANGKSFPTNHMKHPITEIHVVHGGQVYSLKPRIAE